MAIFASGTIFFFLLYWIATILYVAPDNPIRNLFSKELKQFEIYCYQKWTFFAPPPTYNTKLYYTFCSRITSERKTFSALDIILSEKRAHTPFNTGEELLDYVLSGSVEQVVTYLRKGNHSSIESLTIDPRLNLAGLKTLKRYASLIADKQGLNRNAYSVFFSSYSVDMAEIDTEGKSVNSARRTSEKLRFITRPFNLEDPSNW